MLTKHRQELRALSSRSPPQPRGGWGGAGVGDGGLLAVLHTCQTLSHPRAFAPAAPSAWNVLSLIVYFLATFRSSVKMLPAHGAFPGQLSHLNPLYFSPFVLYFYPWGTSPSRVFYELLDCSPSAGVRWSEALCRWGLCLFCSQHLAYHR